MAPTQSFPYAMSLFGDELASPAYDDGLNAFASSTSRDAMPLSLHEVPSEAATETLYDGDQEVLDLSATDWIVADVLTQDLQCRYRKGKCDRPRTLKKNGNLHSFCEFHRQRSIRNQRKFDRKRQQRPATPVQRQVKTAEEEDPEGISEAVWV